MQCKMWIKNYQTKIGVPCYNVACYNYNFIQPISNVQCKMWIKNYQTKIVTPCYNVACYSYNFIRPCYKVIRLEKEKYGSMS